MVVVGRDVGFQEGQDIFPVPFQTFDQTVTIRVLVGYGQYVVKPLMQAQQTVGTLLFTQRGIFVQAQGIAQKTGNLFAEGEPFRGLIGLGYL